MMGLSVRRLGRTGMIVPPIGLGGAGILMDRHVAATDAAAADVAAFAIDCGMRYVDTAPLYGTASDARSSERRLGLALQGRGHCAVATKVGRLRGTRGEVVALGGADVRASVLESRRLLGRERLDVVQVHELTADIWDAVFAAGGALAELRELRAEGVVSHIGVTGSDPLVLRRAVATGAFDIVQVWRAWNLLDRSGEPLLQEAHDAGVGVVVGAPFASGILVTGEPSEELFYGPADQRELRRVRTLAALCAEYDVPLAAAALRCCLDERVATVVVGVRSREDAVGTLTAAAVEVPPELLERLEEVGSAAC